MFKIISLFCVSLWLTHAQSQALPLSAYRQPGTSYLNYAPRSIFSTGGSTAYNAAKVWDKLDVTAMEDWKDKKQVTEAFLKVRDTRFLKLDDKPSFLRRSSWLYPMDGCFARAGLAVKNLIEWNYPKAYKVFVFGDLNVKTVNSSSGQVTWWFHVVPAVRVDKDIYILDPAIEPQKPLLLKEWLETMSVNIATLNVSVCDARTYSPYDSCDEGVSGTSDWGRLDQNSYLSSEWSNLLGLHRDPEKELGDFPPWLNASLIPVKPAPLY